MLKLRFCFFTLLISFSNALTGQINDLHRIINWGPNQAYYNPEKNIDGKNEYFLFFFDKAVYRHEINNLPYYYELIPIDNSQNKVLIENQLFSEIDRADLKDISGLESIPNNIEPNFKIVKIRKKSFIQLLIIPIRKNVLTGNYEKLISFDIRLIESGVLHNKNKTRKAYAPSSVLSSGKWIKIKIDRSGVYKISFDQLRSLGVTDPQNARIFGNGGKMLPEFNNIPYPDDLIENKILIQNSNIYFYGEGPVSWNYESVSGLFKHQNHLYSNFAFYFISSDYNPQTNNSIELEEQSTSATTNTVTTFNDYNYHEVDNKNLINSGRLWVGEEFDITTEYNFTFNVPDIVDNSTINVESSWLARSPIQSSFSIQINSQTFNSIFSPVNYDHENTFASQKNDKYQINSGTSDLINIKTTYNKNTASALGWLDYLRLNFQMQLVFGNSQLHFRNTECVGSGNVSQFTISQTNNQTQVWDISDRQKPRKINNSQNGSNMIFKVNTDSLREFIAFNDAIVYSPITEGEGTGLVENQNLHAISQADMVIICHPNFYQQANTLKQIHEENDNLSIALVTNQQIYNEFSSGAPDISAIKNFLRMLYDRAGGNTNEMPKYLCLFGDGSFDNKGILGQNSNFILTYQSENSITPTSSFVTDDFYGLLDDDEGGSNGYLDIGIGRLPVKTATEASDAINKIRSYINIASYGSWRNNICFVADDENGVLHINDADRLSTLVKNTHPEFNIEKVYLDAFIQQSSASGERYPDANIKLNNLVSKGLLIMNYSGHGNEKQLAEEVIMSIDQINKYENINKLMLWMTATCEFSRFDNFTKTTAGEYAFLNPKGGAIALFTTTRLVYAAQNYQLNTNFYNYIFENNPATGSRYTFGDVMMLTKNATGYDTNTRNFTLLGDPALKLAYANIQVKTLSINGQPVVAQTDTLKAYQKVTVKGEIQSELGLKINGYNGLIYPVVFDKKQQVKTLDNDGQGSYTYSIMNSQIFKGKASVTDGEFQFSFIVPKDIRYNVDTGKISYYATNYILKEDSRGYFNKFMIGGVSSLNSLDNKGPDMKIYLNDESFVNGGITNKNPKLIVYLSDSSGINTTGNGIGHDIIATIDNNPAYKYIINDYYESEIDDYSKGKINFNFPDLPSGDHKLSIKVWDAFNNSTEDSLDFKVALSEQLEISHVLNYPNPFSTKTSFFFEHNRPNELLEVIIHIYTVSGKIIKTIHSNILSNGFRSSAIPWDGLDDFANKPGRGVYFYKMTVRTILGESVSKLEKLLILN